ncbi:MAG: hypothetical protein FWH07_06710 [Oscillospiraceae bacterium]|nr:hypothetical protein [Oscillospiraceae bacterium]
MKKLIQFAIISVILLQTGCGLLYPTRSSDDSFGFPATDSSAGDIIDSYVELDKIIAFMSDNFIMSQNTRISSMEIWKNLDEYYDKNPGILALRGIRGVEISYRNSGGVLDANILPDYEMFMKVIIAHETNDTTELTSEEMQVYNKAKQIIQSVSGTVFDKVYSIHTYLADNIVYDHNHEYNKNAFNVYGALIDGVTVCQGYAHAFQMLAHMAGVESLIVTGVADGDNHAWNLVNYGKSKRTPEWYHIDVTWNDQDEVSSRRYFNISDSILSVSHAWNPEFYPNADGVKYNYFRYKGIIAASPANLESIFASLYQTGENYYEVLCAFSPTADDLAFLDRYVAGSFMYSIEDYDGDLLLTIML